LCDQKQDEHITITEGGTGKGKHQQSNIPTFAQVLLYN